MKTKIKVLLCHNYYQQTGGESSVFEAEVNGLRSYGHPIVLYNRYNSELDHMNTGQKLAMISMAYFSPKTRNDIQALVVREKPDLAIVQNVFPLISPTIYIALHDLNIPIIQTVYNYRLICPAAELYSHGEICERCLGGNYLHCILRRCYRNNVLQSAWYASILWGHRNVGTFHNKIGCYMVPDNFMKNKLVEAGYSPEKIWRNVNPFFVNPERPSPSHQKYVLFIGRFIRQKGVLTLLEAMSHVQSEARLVLVGKGELENEIVAAIDRLNIKHKVTLNGPSWGKEVERLISGASAVVIPSEWYDNQPQILCQANAMGRPVIASRIDGLPEYVQEGENGFLFTPGVPSELAKCIDKVTGMSEEAYKSLSTSAREKAEREFDYHAHYKTLAEIMETVIGKIP